MSSKIESSKPPFVRIVGIDQLRYVFAIWVFFTHGGAPPFFDGHANTPFWDLIQKTYGWMVNGQAAVMGFFIISGLCIHFPNIKRQSLSLASFYTARLLRLTLPLLGCLGIAYLLNFHHKDGFLRAVPIWTLYCEAIYYCLYPIVFWCSKRGYFKYFLIGTSLLSFACLIIWASDRNMYFHEIGGKGNGGFLAWRAALLAFPIWLLGCLIAERITVAEIVKDMVKNTPRLLFWRIGALLLSTITFPLYRVGLYFHVILHPILGLFFSSQFTLLVFGIYCYFWIEREIVFINFGTEKANKTFENYGLASYSLYLVHTLVIWCFDKISPALFPGYLLFWLLLFITLHLCTYIFYTLVEKPSHKISKYCASFLK